MNRCYHLYRLMALGLLLACGSACPALEAAVNFADHIEPIVRENCVDCHNPNGIGPFSLTTYEQVRRRGRQIAEVTQSRYMPPWKPDPEYSPPLQGQRRLTDRQIELIQTWVAEGRPPGNLDAVTPAPMISNSWQLGEPDWVLQLPEAYILPAEGLDVYRNFVVPLPAFKETVYVRAFEMIPQTRLAIHHALLMFDETDRSRNNDAAEAGPGWDGMGIGSSEPPSGHIVGWTPGQTPYQAYPGTAWELEPGTDLVLQLHLLPSGKPEAINPRIGLYLSDEPPRLPSLVLQMRSYDLEIKAGDDNYLVEQALALPVDAKVLGVYPHAHYLGKDIQLFATLPDESKQWLLRIPDWDFNWQGDYRYQDPVRLPAGSVIHMRYQFDNSADNPRNPHYPPRDVFGGWRSEDEMAEAMIQVIPEKPEDLAQLRQAQKTYDIGLAGGEARFHYFSGIYLERQNQTDRAIDAYQRALEHDESFASAYYRLGAILGRQGQWDQAEQLYQEALAYEPELISARLGLAALMLQRNQLRPAGFILKEVYSESPDHLQACLYLARYHLLRGEQEDALRVYQEGETYFEDNPQFHLEYGQALQQSDRDQAKQRFQRAAEAMPEQPDSGAVKPMKQVHAEAYYQLALLCLEDQEFQPAREALTATLQENPDHLDGLLKAAALAIQADDSESAENYLASLVDRPIEQTFAARDILKNVPLPDGAIALTNAYLQCNKRKSALDTFNLAVAILEKQGKLASAAELRERFSKLLN